MRAVSARFPNIVRLVRADEALAPTPWIGEVFGVRLSDQLEGGDFAATVARGTDATLISVCVPDAAGLDPAAFERATTFAYNTIRTQLGEHHPVRFWNHIPSIHAVMDSERDRYMVFNAGRFRAFESWYGSRTAFSRHVATASGVGHSGRDLVIHCLATKEHGTAIENPRQVASYKYSRRYGPLPPCFARATKVQCKNREFVLVGGTASIRGEDSIHLESLALQLDETFENLARLAPLNQYTHLRIYFRREQDVPQILDAVQTAFGSLQAAEVIQAELCRSELLVEIEGLAQL
jgi:hypothetical protein